MTCAQQLGHSPTEKVGIALGGAKEMMMNTTTIKLTGGILGSEKMMVRCQLANAAAPVEVDYCDGSGWQHTQYQAGDARHTTSGLAKVGIELAQSAVQERGTCDWIEVE